jgi:hypothetical protein
MFKQTLQSAANGGGCTDVADDHVYWSAVGFTVVRGAGIRIYCKGFVYMACWLLHELIQAAYQLIILLPELYPGRATQSYAKVLQPNNKCCDEERRLKCLATVKPGHPAHLSEYASVV